MTTLAEFASRHPEFGILLSAIEDRWISHVVKSRFQDTSFSIQLMSEAGFSTKLLGTPEAFNPEYPDDPAPEVILDFDTHHEHLSPADALSLIEAIAKEDLLLVVSGSCGVWHGSWLAKTGDPELSPVLSQTVRGFSVLALIKKVLRRSLGRRAFLVSTWSKGIFTVDVELGPT